MANDAVPAGDMALTLWAESPDEARGFLARASRAGISLPIQRVFVAKRSPKVRHNRYIRGEYYPATVDDAIDVFDEVVIAPQSIIDLVDWCTCDIMLTNGAHPLVVFEDTTHIVRMNLYQRIPRLARAAALGTPAAILQGTRGLDFRLRGDRWGMYRYLQAFEAIARVHPNCPVVPFWYLPTIEDELVSEKKAFDFISAGIEGDTGYIRAVQQASMQNLRDILHDGFQGVIAPDIPSIDHSASGEVIVNVGADPTRKSWREKGSGQMDPYVGMILAAKYIYCYDERGVKVKDLVLRFTKLPVGFWFFADPDTTALYKRLPIEFADRVEFLG
jgi:hypothetical protein